MDGKKNLLSITFSNTWQGLPNNMEEKQDLRSIIFSYPWFQVKGKLDRNNYLQSAYAQGTVWTNRGGKGGLNESTLSLCSSIVD